MWKMIRLMFPVQHGHFRTTVHRSALSAEAAFIQEAASSKQVIQIFMALANFVSSPVLDNVEFKSNASIVPVADAFII
jgi:hypothetical protein